MPAKRDIYGLVIGANGLVGKRVGRMLLDKGVLWEGTCHKRHDESLIPLDITNPDEIRRLFSAVSPSIVFHCANLAGGVDFCEHNQEAARLFHFNATSQIGERCKDIGAKLVFMSTDYVFDGAKGTYKEEDEPHPLNAYGRLKLESERWITRNLNDYLIIRTTNVFGWDPQTVTPNYVMTIYRTLGEGKVLDAPSFLWGSPTYVGDLAEALIELCDKGACGIFHVVGKSFINRFEWAQATSRVFGFDSALVKETRFPKDGMVPRPLRPHLATEKFAASYETELHDVSDGLRFMKAEMDDKQKIFHTR